METEDLLTKPISPPLSCSVEVILFSSDLKKVCLVLESGGEKRKGTYKYEKPRAWENPGGGVHRKETILDGAKREVSQETGFPSECFSIIPMILEKKEEGTIKCPHLKVVLAARLLCNDDAFPFEINPMRDTIGRIFVPLNELPELEHFDSWKAKFGDEEYPIFFSHLRNILQNQKAISL